MIRSEIKDRHGKEICAGDTLRFINKQEWYRVTHRNASDAEIAALPYEERIIKLPEDYAWLLSSEIQEYWEISKRRGPKVKANKAARRKGK